MGLPRLLIFCGLTISILTIPSFSFAYCAQQGEKCDDQNNCTGDDLCQCIPSYEYSEDGTVTGFLKDECSCSGDLIEIDDSDPCTEDRCDPATGNIEHTLIPNCTVNQSEDKQENSSEDLTSSQNATTPAVTENYSSNQPPAPIPLFVCFPSEETALDATSCRTIPLSTPCPDNEELDEDELKKGKAIKQAIREWEKDQTLKNCRKIQESVRNYTIDRSDLLGFTFYAFKLRRSADPKQGSLLEPCVGPCLRELKKNLTTEKLTIAGNRLEIPPNAKNQVLGENILFVVTPPKPSFWERVFKW